MRVIKYQNPAHHELKKDPAFDHGDWAHQLVQEVGTDLGHNLHYDGTNEVHGYMNTSSDGTVEIHLYEQEDIEAIDAHPHQKHPVTGKTARTKTHGVVRTVANIEDHHLLNRLHATCKIKRGFVEHPDHDMHAAEILKGDHTGIVTNIKHANS